jgi:hypothetical protein
MDDLEWLDKCNEILDICIRTQKRESLTTPEMMERFIAFGMDPDRKPLHVAGLLATAIQRLAHT